MKQVTLEQLLEAGCHFGHQVTRSNPKARDFVFEARDNIQIIDLVKTKEGLDVAAEFIRNLGEKGQSLLIVGTKRQARDIIEEEIKKADDLLKEDKKDGIGKIYYVTQRWVGGILTNFSEVSKNFKKLQDLKDKLASPEEKAKYTKKEVGQWEKEVLRLESFYEGIWKMPHKPDCLFIVDSHLENLAVREALATNVPTVAIVDTNADPFVVDYPIPANDDAIKSISLIVRVAAEAVADGKAAFEKKASKEAAKKEKEQKND